MTPEEAGADLARIFSGPQPLPGKDRWHRLQYELVRLDDGTIDFARNPRDAETSRTIADAIEQLFPEPAPAEDVELPSGRI
jgi:hypothetical protein